MVVEVLPLVPVIPTLKSELAHSGGGGSGAGTLLRYHIPQCLWRNPCSTPGRGMLFAGAMLNAILAVLITLPELRG